MCNKVGTIIMSGISIGWFNITDRVNTNDNQGAKWTVQCPMNHTFPMRGTKLRKHIRDGTEPKCPRCN